MAEQADALALLLYWLGGYCTVLAFGMVWLAVRNHKTNERVKALEARLLEKGEFSTS